MTQSTFIFGALIAGFVLYLTSKGRLSTYGAILWGKTTQPVTAPSNSGFGGGSNSDPLASIGQAAEIAGTVFL